MKKRWISLFLPLVLILSLTSPVSASTPYVIDDAGLLLPEERIELNAAARRISETYGCGVYLMSVWDYRDYGSDSEVFDVTWNIYHDRLMGYGDNREGMILLLSMEGRDFATFFYGDFTEYAFNSYGQEQLEDYFLDNFADDDWYGGFRDYLNTAEEFLAKAKNGDPVRESPLGLSVLFVMIACFISFLVTMFFWSQMNNVRLSSAASGYAAQSGLCLTHQKDTFVHQTRTRRKIPQQSSSSGGSRSFSGGGGSGRSGKF